MLFFKGILTKRILFCALRLSNSGLFASESTRESAVKMSCKTTPTLIISLSEHTNKLIANGSNYVLTQVAPQIPDAADNKTVQAY